MCDGNFTEPFTMDKILENEWDKAVEKFMRSHEIVCT